MVHIYLGTLQERWNGFAGAYAAIKGSRLELQSGASELGAATPERTALRRICTESKKFGLWKLSSPFKDG